MSRQAIPPRSAAAFLATLLLAGGCAQTNDQSAPTIESARIALPAAPGVPAAGYFTVTGGAGDRLLAASSPEAERIEMHETASDARGVTSMRPLGPVPLDGGVTTFQPAGRHLMIHGLRGDLQAGGRVPLTLRFERAAEVIVQADLVAPGQAHGGH